MLRTLSCDAGRWGEYGWGISRWQGSIADGGDKSGQPRNPARKGGRPAGNVQSKLNQEIMQEIMAFKSAGELCACIEAKATDFNYVAVATAFRQLLKMARQAGVRPITQQSALQVLEDVMMRKMGDFGPLQVASTLHIMAKARYRPYNRALLPELELQIERVVSKYNAQNVANTVWAYARMGREPGEGVMGMLEGRMGEVAGE